MKYLRITVLSFAIALMAFGLVACGGGSSATPGATTSASSMATSLTLGDAPADDVVSYEITINSITLTGAKGTTPNLLAKSRRLELTHLSATVEALATTPIPVDNFTSAQINWSSPEVTFLNSSGVPVEVQSSASKTTTVQVSLNLQNPTVLNLDLDVANSVTVNPTAGTATFAADPAFSFTPRGLGEAEREAETGEIENMSGRVTAASSTSITIDDFSQPFTIDSTTKLEGITAVDSTLVGKIVQIEGTTRTDGSVLAKELEVETADGNGSEVEGLVTSVGSPTATSFTLIVQDGSGLSLSSTDLGKEITVDAANANFTVGKTKIDFTSAGFSFSSIANLQPGQRVEVDSDTPKSAGAGTASDDGSMDAAGVKKVKLQQQAVKGQITAVSGTHFTLSVTLPASIVSDAVAAGITNCSTSTNICAVDVVTNASTQLKNGVSITATGNPTVRVRGLLFGGTTGYHLVAGRVTTP